MRWFSIVLTVIGVALIYFLVRQHTGVFSALVSLGAGGLFVVVLIHLFQVVLSGHAWWLVQSATAPLGRWPCYWLRLVREGINNLVPVTQVGGEVVAVRILFKRAVRIELAGAAIIFDIALEFLSQIVFTILALVLFYQFFEVPDELLRTPEQ